ncbi:glycoside hydrolase [Massarina eburnea CBS 473.64]|uniref:AA9 family lytic polysaccharide monooxygenase n=1 Tax=Massarina eburnea CBS 473.64 TaxID=1395130 RepID=A0A6A6RN96_9PLEO|nr:glycoside hydrolase [Massarina eburnea CBS 473.64]
MRLSVATTIAALSGTAFAHGGVVKYTINGTVYATYDWGAPFEGQKDLIQRSWTGLPHTSVTAANLTCSLGQVVPGAFHATVPAGGVITSSWDNGYGWPHTIGPITAYLASCGTDCTTVTDLGSLEWFKIAEEGLRAGFAVGEEDGWFQNDLWENRRTDHWDITVPKTLKPGRYLVRHEIVNLELSPIQFYPNCAALEISGTGASVPTAEYLVKFPGAYALTDPGIAISGNVRNDKTTKNYTVPGPKVWSG